MQSPSKSINKIQNPMIIIVKGDFGHEMFAFNHVLELETLLLMYAGPGT